MSAKSFLIRFLVKYVHFLECFRAINEIFVVDYNMFICFGFGVKVLHILKLLSLICMYILCQDFKYIVHFDKLALYFTSIGFVIFQTAWVDFLISV